MLNSHLLVAKYLVELGVDQTHKDKLDKTAKDYAMEQEKNCKGKQELVVIKNMLALLEH